MLHISFFKEKNEEIKQFHNELVVVARSTKWGSFKHYDENKNNHVIKL